MTDVIADIETLKDVLIAWEEGASDEKRFAKEQLRNMLARKEREMDMFEADLEAMYENVPQ